MSFLILVRRSESTYGGLRLKVCALIGALWGMSRVSPTPRSQPYSNFTRTIVTVSAIGTSPFDPTTHSGSSTPASTVTMAELTVQSERAFLKQPHIFQNPKTAGKTKEKRWYKDVGLGFKTPKEAIEGTYIGILFFCWSELMERQEMSFHWSNLDPWSYS